MTRTVRKPLAAAVILAAGVTGVLSLSLMHSDTLPPCAYEDGSNSPTPCHWEAQKQGNGLGQSVTIWTKP
jgi:hypothetical protein